jgi:hypothetical protein
MLYAVNTNLSSTQENLVKRAMAKIETLLEVGWIIELTEEVDGEDLLP